MPAGGKVPLGHNGDHQLPVAQGIQDALRLRGGAAFYVQPLCLSRAGDQGVVGTALTAPAAVFIGPLCHLHRVNNVVRQRGHHDGHGGGAAAVAADVVCAVGLIGPAFVQLVEVDDLRGSVGKSDVPQGGNRSAAVFGVLEHPIAQEQTEVLGIVPRQRFLIVCQMEYCIGKIALAVVGEGIDVPGLLPCLHHVLGVRVVVLHRPGLAGAGVGIEAALALPENGLHIRQGDCVPGFAFGGAVLGDKGVGVAAHVGGVGVDNLVVISASGSEVLGDPGLRIGDALAQNLIDGKSDVVGVLDDGGIVIEDGLAGAAAAGQAAEDQGGQHEDEQHREHE